MINNDSVIGSKITPTPDHLVILLQEFLWRKYQVFKLIIVLAEMRAFCAVVVLVCVLVCSNAAPINEQGQSRNFIPNRFEIGGTLINNDGTFTRQEIPDEPQQSMFNQFGGDQPSNLAYQQQAGYTGGQQFQENLQPQANFMADQNDQNSYLQNSQLAPEQNMQGYVDNAPQNDDLGGEGQMYNSMGQEYQPNYNDQEPPQIEFQGGQYNDQSPLEGPQQMKDVTPSSQDDIKGSNRDTIVKNKEKEREKMLGATKKFKIPKNLSTKDLQGMIGYAKQVYLRGGHQ